MAVIYGLKQGRFKFGELIQELSAKNPKVMPPIGFAGVCELTNAVLSQLDDLVEPIFDAFIVGSQER